MSLHAGCTPILKSNNLGLSCSDANNSQGNTAAGFVCNTGTYRVPGVPDRCVGMHRRSLGLRVRASHLGACAYACVGVLLCLFVCLRVCVCHLFVFFVLVFVRVFLRACMRACACACVRTCVYACVRDRCE